MKKLQTFLLVLVFCLMIPMVYVHAADKTADEYYKLVSQYTADQPYQALTLLKEANAAYPNDQRFIDGIKARTLTILSWSQGSQSNGSYSAAIYGYDTVIATAVVPQYIKDFAVRQKALATANKASLSINDYLSLLSKYNDYQPYDTLNLYSEALVGYPSDKRLIDGINKSANTILEWSIGSHRSKHYEAALYGYNTVINAPDSVYKETKEKAIFLLDYAKQNKDYYTADEYFAMVSKIDNNHPYDSLNLNIQANKTFPYDQRFINGINASAATILNWSMGSHSANNFGAAAYGYNTIKNIAVLPTYMKDFASRQADNANNNKPITTADEYNNMSMQYDNTRPYNLLKINDEALVAYPNDQRFKTGVNSSARTILEWSKGSHGNRSYDAAIYGYQTVLDSYAPSYMKKNAERNKSRASQGLLPLTADEYYNIVRQASLNTPYDLLNLGSEGLISYSSDSRFLTAINNAASVILDWSIGSHIRGNYDAAIYGYQTLLDSLCTDNAIRTKANFNIQTAKKGTYSIIGNKTIVLDAGHNFGGDDGAYGNGYAERNLNMQVVTELQKILEANGVKTILTRQPGDVSYASLDESLSQRTKIANNSNADLFLSIHHDSSSDPNVGGTSAYYSSYRSQLDTSDVYVKVLDTGGSIKKGSSSGSVIATAKVGETYPFVSEQDGGFIINYKGTLAWISNAYCRAYDPTPSEAARLSSIIADTLTQNISSLGLLNRGVTDRNLYVTRNTTMPSVLVEVGFVSNASEVNKIAQPSFQKQVAMKIWDAIVSLFTR